MFCNSLMTETKNKFRLIYIMNKQKMAMNHEPSTMNQLKIPEPNNFPYFLYGF
jgi:hypothetical protein